jgi:predicted nucleotidyltransferase
VSVAPEFRSKIQNELARIALEHGVRILYAVESGSRAWGFASKDSDYDGRFLYVHSRDWYLSIESGRDVIEAMLPGDLDLSGWELKKALRLLRKSNPPFYEWLRSPIVYVEDEAFMSRLREVAVAYYSPERCFQHYLHMAFGNKREYLTGETVWVKKYLYVLRPLLGCRWIEKGLGPVPMEFEKLAASTLSDPALVAAIQGLLARKRAGAELDEAEPIPEISTFIEAELERLSSLLMKPGALPPPDELNELFRWTIG